MVINIDIKVVLRIQGQILTTNEAVHGQKIKNSQSQLKMYWFFKKELKPGLK